MTATTTKNHLADVIAAQALERAGLADWIPEGEGKWSLPIQFLPDDAGWVELMRLSPGTRLGLHRHTGEVHALTLAGERRLNDGRVVRPGDYIHEPAGNVGLVGGAGHRRAAGACGGQGQRGIPAAAPYGAAADHHGRPLDGLPPVVRSDGEGAA